MERKFKFCTTNRHGFLERKYCLYPDPVNDEEDNTIYILPSLFLLKFYSFAVATKSVFLHSAHVMSTNFLKQRYSCRVGAVLKHKKCICRLCCTKLCGFCNMIIGTDSTFGFFKIETSF